MDQRKTAWLLHTILGLVATVKVDVIDGKTGMLGLLRELHSLAHWQSLCDILPGLDDPAQQTFMLWVASPWHLGTAELPDDSWCPR